MPGMRWDGKLYRPAKFGEGMRPGTVEWERARRARQADRERLPRIVAERDVEQSRPAIRSSASVFSRAFGKLLGRFRS